jgi:hypothetical protein
VEKKPEEMLENYVAKVSDVGLAQSEIPTSEIPLDDRTKEEITKEEDTDLYNISNFSV